MGACGHMCCSVTQRADSHHGPQSYTRAQVPLDWGGGGGRFTRLPVRCGSRVGLTHLCMIICYEGLTDELWDLAHQQEEANYSNPSSHHL